MKHLAQRTITRWAAHLDAGGLRRWWTLGSLTRHRNQPAVARLLAQCLQKITSPLMSQRAEKALHRINSQPAIDAVIGCWQEREAGETVRQIIEEQGWRHSDEATWLKFLTQRNRFDEYFVAELTPHVNKPAVARVLARHEGREATEAAVVAAAAALGQISAPDAVDAVIDCWQEDKAGETTLQVIEERRWRHSDESMWLKFLTQRNRFDEYFVAELTPYVNKPAVVRMLVHPEGAYASHSAARAAAVALGQISAPEPMDAVIDCWLGDMAGETALQVIEERRWRHSDESMWLKFFTKRNRFDEYFVAQLAPLVDDPERVARMLVLHEGREATEAAAVAAAAALGQISTPEAVDAVIDCWLEDKAGETVLQVIEERGWQHFTEVPWAELFTELEDSACIVVSKVIEGRGWRHSEEARWFLYLAATGRFDEYLAGDYEFQTLRPEFLAASAALKVRIREAVVKAGEVRMNGLFLAQKDAADLTVADAEALVHINIRNKNWETLAGNLWWLPARQILDAVLAIIAAKWKPDDDDQASLLEQLGKIASQLASCSLEGTGSLPVNPVYKNWLSNGETGPLFQKSPAELKAMLKDVTDPPDQIAAMGALRMKGHLDAATVAKAGHSEHWMVRWVAVHFGADLTQAMQVNDAGVEWFRRLAILRNYNDAEDLWIAKPCEVTRDGLEALRKNLASLPDPRAAGGLPLVEAICTHYTGHDFEVEEGSRVLIAEDSFELEG